MATLTPRNANSRKFDAIEGLRQLLIRMTPSVRRIFAILFAACSLGDDLFEPKPVPALTASFLSAAFKIGGKSSKPGKRRVFSNSALLVLAACCCKCNLFTAPLEVAYDQIFVLCVNY